MRTFGIDIISDSRIGIIKGIVQDRALSVAL